MSQITSEDLAATLSAFTICLVAALKPAKGNETLEKMANELDEMAKKAAPSPMSDTLALTSQFLMASEP